MQDYHMLECDCRRRAGMTKSVGDGKEEQQRWCDGRTIAINMRVKREALTVSDQVTERLRN
jgi:hypothetical protein